MIIILVIISLADIITTNLGIVRGFVELNIFVLSCGLGLWGIFRIGLLCYIATVFFLGYRYCYKHSMNRALAGLRICLLVIDIYIAIVVNSNVFVLLKLI
jgi:hypothetical protein